MKRSRYTRLWDLLLIASKASLLGAGMVVGFLLGALVMTPSATQAAAGDRYRVERLAMSARQPEGLQELLEKRAEEGWLLQVLDHETMIFRRAGAAPKPTPPPE